MSDDGRYRRVSVILPVLNKRAAVAELIRRARIAELPVDKEIVVLDEGSTDGTRAILSRLADSTVRVVFRHDQESPGAALRRALDQARGQIIVLQNGASGQDGLHWRRLVDPILAGQADLVCGGRTRRYAPSGARAALSRLLLRLLYGVRLRDPSPPYRAMRTELVRSLRLESDDDRIVEEIFAKVLRSGARILEVGLEAPDRPANGNGHGHRNGNGRTHRPAHPGPDPLLLLRYRLASSRELFRSASR